MDKIEQLYNLYIQNGIITSATSLDMFRAANEQQQNSLYELGKQKNLFQTTDLPTFQSAWSGVIAQPQAAPQPEEVKKKGESDTMELAVAGSLSGLPSQQEPTKPQPVATPQATVPQFFQSSLDIITPDLINEVEEVVVPKMNYQFGPMGFKFEESGITGDYMIATAPNGKQMEFSLDPYFDSSAKEESEKIKKFISENTDVAGLASIENQYKGVNRKFASQEEINNELKKVNEDAEYFKSDVNNFLIQKASLEKEKEFLDNNASDKSSMDYIVRQSSYNKGLEQLKAKEEELVKRQNSLNANNTTLQSAVGRYVMMAEQQGTPGEMLFNKLLRGLTMMAPSVVNVGADIGAALTDTNPMKVGGDKFGAVEAARKLGYKTPSFETYVGFAQGGKDTYIKDDEVGKFNNWYNSLSQEQRDEIEDKMRDNIAKEAKYGKTGEVGAFTAAKTAYKDVFGGRATEEYGQKLEKDSFLAMALGGVAESLPAMIGGPGAIGWVQRGAQMYAQATDAIYEEMANNPNFKDISEDEKRLIAAPIGVAEASLEAIGLRNVIANKGLMNKVILKAIGKSGATTTAKTFGELVRNEINSVALKGGLTLAGAALAEAETGGAQQISEYAFKDIYNALKGKEMFTTPEMFSAEYFAEVGKAAAAEAIGGLVLGVPSAVSTAYSKKGYNAMNNQLFDVFEASAKDPEIQKAFVVDLKTRVARGEITLEQAKKTLNDYRNSVGLFNSLPENLDTNEKKEAMNLLKEKRDLEQQISGKDEALTRRQRNRINDINTELEALSDKAATRTRTVTLPTGNEIQVDPDKATEIETLMSEYNQLTQERSNFEERSKVGTDGILDEVTNTVEFFNTEQELNDELQKRWEQTDLAKRQAEILNEITTLATPAVAPAPTQQATILSTPETTTTALNELPSEEKTNITFMQEDGTETPVMGNEQMLSDLYHQAMATPEAERTPAQLSAVDAVQVSLKTQLEQEAEQQARPERATTKAGIFKNTIQSLMSVMPEIKVTNHKNLAEMKAYAEREFGNEVSKVFGSGDAGVIIYDQSNKPVAILVNDGSADATTLPHEAWHGIFFKAFGDNPQLFKEFQGRVRQILLDNGYDDVVRQLDDFVDSEGYKQSDTQAEEWMVQLGAYLTASGLDPRSINNRTLLQQLKDLFNEFAKRITGQPIFLEDATPEDVLDFMVAISDRMSRGESIADFFRNEEQRQGEGGPRVKPQVAGKTGFAPNGKPSNLTAEQYKLVRTPEFKAWFGDWENDPKNASKVVDENGEPLVVYHGSPKYTYRFDENKKWTEFENKRFDRFDESIKRFSHTKKGFYFGGYQAAKEYADANGEVYEVFLKSLNPLVNDNGVDFSVDGKIIFSNRLTEENYNLLVKNKIDGLISYLPGKQLNEIVVFDSKQIKLADGSNTTFDNANPSIKFQQAGKTGFENNPVYFDNVKGFASKSSFDNKIQFKKAVQDLFTSYIPELKKKYGKAFNPSKNDALTKKYLSDIITAEAVKAIEEHPEAIGWYDEKTRSALDVISAIHPEIATDKEARGSFILPLAVMSNGNLVDFNFDLAEKQYDYFKKNGRFNPNGGFGLQQSGIKKSILLINSLLDNGLTMSDINTFLTSKYRAGDLKVKIDGKVKNLASGELADEMVYGAVILGPKIGNGFYMNLWGQFDQLTMDRWFMRTWGRLTGTLLKTDKAAINEGKKRVSNALDAIKSDPEALAILKSVVPKLSGVSPADLAKTIEKVSMDTKKREVLASNPNTDELRKAGNSLSKNISGEKEAPANGNERKFIRDVFTDVARRLKKENNIDITMADLQAVLWYPEKILYESFKGGQTFEEASEGYTSESAPDYFNAAKKLATKLGVNETAINQALSRGRERAQRSVGETDTTVGESVSGTNKEALKRVTETIEKPKQGKPRVKSQVASEGTSLFRTEEDANIGFQYDTDKVARERFNIYRLKKIGSGSDRVVFDLGDGKVLKVAKTARGLEQNIYEGDAYNNVIPKVFERGLNYVVTEKANPLRANDMVPTYNEDGDQIGEARAADMISDLQGFSQRDFDNHRSQLQDVLMKYGLQDIINYDVLWPDFIRIANWGYKDGMPLHTDGGTFGGVDMLTSRSSKSLTDPEFREIYEKSKKAKKEFGDTDIYVKFQKSGNTGFEQVKKVAQRYNVNNQGFAPKQVNDSAMRKELEPLGYSTRRARVDEQGRGGGVFIVDGNGRFVNPFRVKPQISGKTGLENKITFYRNGKKLTVDLNRIEVKQNESRSAPWKHYDILFEGKTLGYIQLDSRGDDLKIAISGLFPGVKNKTELDSLIELVLKVLEKIFPNKFKGNVILSQDKNQGKGIGTRAYGLLAEELQNKYGKKLISDTTRSDAAEALWRSLERKGLAKVVGDRENSKATWQYHYEYVVPKERIVKSQRINLGAGRLEENVNTIPGYDRMLEEVNAIIERTKRRGASNERIMKGVMDYLQTSAVYERANDTQREQLVRNVQTEFGKRIKSAPSVGRLLGTIKDIKNITLSEKELLKQQIKSLARGARTAVAAWRAANRELTAEIAEQRLSGKVNTKQVASILRRFANVNMFNEESIDKFVDYMTKVFEDANYAEKIERARRLLSTAKKNIRTKIGISEAAAPLLEQLFAINPNLIPDAVLDKYLSLVEMFGEKATVLKLDEVTNVIATADEILTAVDEEVSLAEELAIRFENYADKVFDDDGKLDYAATLAQMQEEDVITEDDAKLMQKYKRLILPKVEKPEMTEAEIEQEKNVLISVINSLDVNDGRLPSRDERNLAKELKALLKPELLKQLTIPQLKNVIKLIDNIDNGYLPHYAQLTVERLDSFKNASSLMESVKTSVPLMFEKAYSRIKSAITKKGAISEMIRRNPLYNMDQIFGDFKTKNIYKSLFEGMAKAQALFDSEINKVNKLLDKAHDAVAKSYGNESNATLFSSFKMMTYMLQLEYESNPGNKEVHPASKVLKATIKHIDNGKSKYGDREADMLQKILTEYSTDGEIDNERLYNSFNPAEKAAIKTIQEINESLRDKAVYTAAVIRGDRINPLNNYVHHYVMHEFNPDERATGVQTADAYNSSMRPSTRAQSLIERTNKVSPMNFDVFASAQRGAKFVLLDYTMTQPIRTGRKTLSQTRIELEKDGRIPKSEREVFNSIESAFDEVVANVLTNNMITDSRAEEIINFISKTGYRAILASVPRFISELTSNFGTIIFDPKSFADGVKLFKKMNGVDAENIMKNSKSVQTNRLYGGQALSGKFIDTSVLGQTTGIKSATAKGDVANVVNKIYNNSLKKYKNFVELTADTLISTPDKLVMRPFWMGVYANAFKKETGQDIDLDKVAANDEAYMNEHKDAITKATDEADRMSVRVGATDNPFMGMLKGTVKPNQSGFTRAFNNFNNFMTRFAIYEYTTAREGIYAAMGNGMITKRQGYALLAGVATRMTVYTLLSQMLGNAMLSLFADDDKDDEKTFMQKFGQSLASTGTGLILGRNFGNATKSLINYGVEEMNKEFLTALREGDYDPYKDAISYSIIPKERKGHKTNLTDFITQMGGSFGPSLKTADLIARKMFEAPKKKEDAIERGKQETQIRIPLEVLGHLGYIPLYKDVRKVVMDQMYKDLENADKKAADKKQAEKEMLHGYENKTDMKRYNPELYEQVFGEKSPGYDAEQAKKKIEKEKEDLERRRKDEFYNYTPKKTQEKSGGFGSKKLGGETKKQSGGFGSKKFGE